MYPCASACLIDDWIYDFSPKMSAGKKKFSPSNRIALF